MDNVINPLDGKKVILGVTGSIAIYKSLHLIRILLKKGIKLRIVMTNSACKLINPVTFESLTNEKPLCNLFDKTATALQHVYWGEWADLMIIAPATANIISKVALGIADDAVSTIALFHHKNMIIAPAMNPNMFKNPSIQNNIKILKERGYTILTCSGEMACGDAGEGRFVEPEIIADYVEFLLWQPKSLINKNVLVTAGATREYIDDIRFISNRSSGKTGLEIAKEAHRRGANVLLISGIHSTSIPEYIRNIEVETSEQMLNAIKENLVDIDFLIMASAVSDFKPSKKFPGKIHKDNSNFNLELIQTQDILNSIKNICPEKTIKIGFSLEPEFDINRATEKLKSKNLDAIFANDISVINSDSTSGALILKNNRTEKIENISKSNFAYILWDIIEKNFLRK